MRSLAIIPARGGSKRIPRKNIKVFCGKPIIAYSIQAAIDSGVFDEIMVSTDDLEIAEIAKQYGAVIPFMRSAELSTDMAMTAPVLLEVLEEYKRRGCEFTYACCIYPAAPFISPEKLKSAYGLLLKTKADSVNPVVRFGYPIQRALKIENNRLEMIWPENLNKRSQDLMPAFHDCGQFYFFNVGSFLRQKTLFMANTAPVEIRESEVQDIDTEEDWKIAEMKYKMMKDGEK
jgi:N-acylneuraminate cytidylyltransferase